MHSGEPDGATFERPTPSPRRILVADDDNDILLLNVEVLKQSGYQVDAVADGAAAWKALDTASHASNNYDLVIIDHDMPGLTGMDVIKKLRAAGMDLPFIMATGTLPESELARSPWLTPAATLLKPYTIEKLLRTVREVLRAIDISGTRPKLPPEWPGQRLAVDLRLYDFTSQPHAEKIEFAENPHGENNP